jgi:hypothetical protein
LKINKSPLFSGLLAFQLFFTKINLKQQLKKWFSHLKVSPIFGRHLVVLPLIVHLLLGLRRLREVDYYRDDPPKNMRPESNSFCKNDLPLISCDRTLNSPVSIHC